MEFLRFGSSIPGGYWGCCACCIIQNFTYDPDEKASIQLVSGDGGGPIMRGKEFLYAGPTYRDIFNQRIRIGTFDSRDMPNHAFLAILTQWQLEDEIGAKWLQILKETGFEFVRTVSNSVYAGQKLGSATDDSPNHIFGLFRNIGTGAISNPFTPPQEWRDLDVVTPEPWSFLDDQTRKDLFAQQRESQKKVWEKIGPAKLLLESEVVAAGAPLTLAGRRSENPQELKSIRENRQKTKADKAAKAAGKPQPVPASPQPWGI